MPVRLFFAARARLVHSAWQLFQGGFLRLQFPPSFPPSLPEHDVVTTTVNIYNLARACDDDMPADDDGRGR